MVDRLARAMRVQCGKVTDDPWDSLSAAAKARWCKRARAILTELGLQEQPELLKK